MNQNDLTRSIANRVGLPQILVNKVVDSMLEEIIFQLKSGEAINLTGFGRFTARVRHARRGFNPKTRQNIDIPEVIIPKFKSGSWLKKELKNKNDRATETTI